MSDDEIQDARARESLHGPVADYCLVGGLIYFFTSQARWRVWKYRDDTLALAVRRLLVREGVREFSTGDEWANWVQTVPFAGGFAFAKRSFRFDSATCVWERNAGISVSAIGPDCKLDFPRLPFAAENLPDLQGRGWPDTYDERGIRRPAKTPLPWSVDIDQLTYQIAGIEIDSGAYNAEPSTLNVFFQGEVTDPTTGAERSISGSLYCRVVAHSG